MTSIKRSAQEARRLIGGQMLEQYVSTASGYGSPYIVFPESVFDLDTSLYVKLRIPFPDNWRF